MIKKKFISFFAGIFSGSLLTMLIFTTAENYYMWKIEKEMGTPVNLKIYTNLPNHHPRDHLPIKPDVDEEN
tara:strand:+ start:313 stop:525 length:213 start_codon:yes stop_codon:yes gene_type:complete